MINLLKKSIYIHTNKMILTNTEHKITETKLTNLGRKDQDFIWRSLNNIQLK